MGVSPSTAYFHFSDKNALFVAAFDREADALCDRVIGDPEAVGEGYWQTVLVRIAAEIGEFPLIHRVVSGLEPGLLRRLFEGSFSRRVREAIATSVRLGRDEGVIRADVDPEVAALGLETVFVSLVLSAVQVGAPGDGERAAAVRYVLGSALASSAG